MMASLISSPDRFTYPHSLTTLERVLSMGMRLKHSCQTSIRETFDGDMDGGSNL